MKDADGRRPKVSVIVLSYNQEKTIRRALESILACNGNVDLEVVVADDNSTDSTRSVISEIAGVDSRVRLLDRCERLGPVGNYFRALDHCRGDYIADCAADDFWLLSGRLEEKMIALDSDPEISIVCADWMIFSPDDSHSLYLPAGSPGSAIRGKMNGREVLRHYLSGQPEYMIHLSTALYRREVIMDALGENKSMVNRPEFGSEDLPLIAALLSRGDILHLDSSPTLAYCVGADSVSNASDFDRRAVYFERTAIMIASIADYYGVDWNLVSDQVSDKLFHAMDCAFRARNSAVARRLNRFAKVHGIKRSSKFRLKHLLLRLVG